MDCKLLCRNILFLRTADIYCLGILPINYSIFKRARCLQRKLNASKEEKTGTAEVLIENFLRTSNLNDDQERQRAAITDDDPTRDPTVFPGSHWRVAAQTGLRWMFSGHLMHHCLHLLLYKIQTRQPLSCSTINARRTFANTMLQQLNASKIGVWNMWFSDEGYLFLGWLRQ